MGVAFGWGRGLHWGAWLCVTSLFRALELGAEESGAPLKRAELDPHLVPPLGLVWGYGGGIWGGALGEALRYGGSGVWGHWGGLGGSMGYGVAQRRGVMRDHRGMWGYGGGTWDMGWLWGVFGGGLGDLGGGMGEWGDAGMGGDMGGSLDHGVVMGISGGVVGGQ